MPIPIAQVEQFNCYVQLDMLQVACYILIVGERGSNTNTCKIIASSVLVLLITGGLCASIWYSSTSYHHGAPRGQSEHTAPTKTSTKRADSSINARTGGIFIL